MWKRLKNCNFTIFLLFVLFIFAGCSKSRTANEAMPQPLPNETENPPAIAPESSVSDVSAMPDLILNEVDYSSYFAGMNGSAVFYTPEKNQYDIYNSALASKQRSPCSTFKIISSLLALQNGVIDPKQSTRKWSGESFWMEEWIFRTGKERRIRIITTEP